MDQATTEQIIERVTEKVKQEMSGHIAMAVAQISRHLTEVEATLRSHIDATGVGLAQPIYDIREIARLNLAQLQGGNERYEQAIKLAYERLSADLAGGHQNG